MNYLFTEEEMKPLIRSVSYQQDMILQSIMYLHSPVGKIELDPCYGSGCFYKSGVIPEPKYICDIEPKNGNIPYGDSRELPFENNSIKSIIFDPPWLTYPGKNRIGKLKRYGSFRTYDEMEKMYRKSFVEFYRVLEKDGILIVKTQDGTKGPDFTLIHVDCVILPCRVIGFKIVDLFLLVSKQRIERRDSIQRHSRKYHSYFLVFKKG